jgi:hypothetical protein
MLAAFVRELFSPLSPGENCIREIPFLIYSDSLVMKFVLEIFGFEVWAPYDFQPGSLSKKLKSSSSA